ncbi:hypothetical protein P5E39_16245, partial [Clostridium perfringens]|nr:hypothetical protein [Clostridium perfringens]
MEAPGGAREMRVRKRESKSKASCAMVVKVWKACGVGGGVGGPARSMSTENIYTRSQLEASAVNKESFFARKIAENESR